MVQRRLPGLGLVAPAIVAIALAACAREGTETPPTATPPPGTNTTGAPPAFSTNPYCPQGEPLCSALPDQIQVPPGCLESDQQCSRDYWSWQSFVSFNWPGMVAAGNVVQPDTGKPITAAGSRVWELWMDPDSVFLPKAVQPTWTPGQAPPAPCVATANAGGGKALVGRLAKASVGFGDIDPDDFFEATIQQPLIDQSLEFVVFEIRMDQNEVEWVVSNKLYQQETVNGLTKDQSLTFPANAVEAKAAWRILPDSMPAAQKDRYYHETATIVLDPEHVQGGGPGPVCVKRELGLVGLHLRRNGLWATFEQVDNVTPSAGITPTFNNPSCTTCTANVPPTDKDGKPIPSDDYEWSLQGPSAGLYQGYPNVPAQITRAPGEDEIIDQRLNQWWQQTVLAGTVWANYMLITTNWIEFPTSSQPIPALNTALEPYIPAQSATYPQACIECHKLATNDNGAALGESFMPFRACPENPQPGQKLPANCTPGQLDTLAAHH